MKLLFGSEIDPKLFHKNFFRVSPSGSAVNRMDMTVTEAGFAKMIGSANELSKKASASDLCNHITSV